MNVLRPNFGTLRRTGRKSVFDAQVSVMLALAFRIRECKQYTLADAQREFGISERTYRRHLARMRAAGIILHCPNIGSRGPRGMVQYIAFDPMFAESCKSA